MTAHNPSSDFLHQIDFCQKWYQTLAIPNAFFDNQFANIFELLNQAIYQTNIDKNFKNYQQKPIKFVAQDDLPPQTAYESFIANTGNIPTRNNFHDLLNGLIWLNFPKTKAVFNQLHDQNIQAHGISNARTPLRNALTLFDENGGVVISRLPTILTALQEFDWRTALFDNAWQHDGITTTQFFAIGHALLEKLITPRKNITAHVLLISADDDFFAMSIDKQRETLDTFLANFFLQQTLFSKMFQPLPILGIPTFCQNQNLDFYQDSSVFREKRLGTPASIYQF